MKKILVAFRLILKTILIFVFCILSACSTGNKQNPSAQKINYNENIDALEISQISPQDIKTQTCQLPPASPFQQDIEQWKVDLDGANACVLVGNWSLVQKWGQHLALATPKSPWGAYYLSLAAIHENNLDRAQWMIELALKKSPENKMLIEHKQRVIKLAGRGGENE